MTKFFKTAIGLLLLGSFFGELIPEPTDFFHYLIQKYVLQHPELSRTTWIILQSVDWYLLSALWYLFLIILAYILHIKKVETIKIVMIIGGLIGLGITVGLIARWLM